LSSRGSLTSSVIDIPSYAGYGFKKINVRNPMMNKKILEKRRQYSHPQLKELMAICPKS